MNRNLKNKKLIVIEIHSNHLKTNQGHYWPKPFLSETKQIRLRDLKKKLKRQEKGSARSKKTVDLIQKIERRFAVRVVDYLHTVLKHVVVNYDIICVESHLPKQFKKVSDVEFEKLLMKILHKKINFYGKELISCGN